MKEKNIVNLATAIESINFKNSSSHTLTIIGEGYELSKLTKFKCIDYKGLKKQKDIVKIAKKCHVFCLPSIYEPIAFTKWLPLDSQFYPQINVEHHIIW